MAVTLAPFSSLHFAQVPQDICRQSIHLYSKCCTVLDIHWVSDSDLPKPAKALGCLQRPSSYSKRPTRDLSTGSITFVDRPAWIYIKETYRHGFHYKKHTRTVRNVGKEGKKTATAMHQSHFSSQNDLLWAGSLFRNKGI